MVNTRRLVTSPMKQQLISPGASIASGKSRKDLHESILWLVDINVRTLVLLRRRQSFCCDLQSRKINFTNSKNFGWLVDVGPTVRRVTFDLPECKELKDKKSKHQKKFEKKLQKKQKNQTGYPPETTRNRAAIEVKKKMSSSTRVKKKKKNS